jgi:hypothetical protein
MRVRGRVDCQFPSHESDDLDEVEKSVFDEVVAHEGAGFRGVPRRCSQFAGVLPRVVCARRVGQRVLHMAPYRSLDKTMPEQRGLG